MSFWEEHEAREREIAGPPPPDPPNMPAECRCGHVGTDVLLGICHACAVGFGCA